jgi:uncharacterized protein
VIYVDTSAWYAAVVPDDPHHNDAARWMSVNRTRLLTTDYVLDETLTLLKARRQYRRALALGDSLFRGEVAALYTVTPKDLDLAWRTFCGFSDKAWSFTDCVSKVVMASLGISAAFAFDEHFRQFAGVTVCPAP